MGVRVRVEIRAGDRRVITSALLNSGYEAKWLRASAGPELWS